MYFCSTLAGHSLSNSPNASTPAPPIPIIVYFLTLLSKWSDPLYIRTNIHNLLRHSCRPYHHHSPLAHQETPTQFTARSLSSLPIDLGSTTIPIYQYNIQVYLCCSLASTQPLPTKHHTLPTDRPTHSFIHSLRRRLSSPHTTNTQSGPPHLLPKKTLIG